MSDRIGDCDVDGCDMPCCASHNHGARHGTLTYGGCKCFKHLSKVRRR